MPPDVTVALVLVAEKPKSMPEPPSATLWGLSVAESTKLIVPDRTPEDVGVNVTRTVQLPLAATAPQVLLLAVKSPVT